MITAALALMAAMPVTPAGAVTLMEALAKAYINNPTLLADRARQRATDEQVPQALSKWRPEVTLSGEISRERVYNPSASEVVQYRTPRTGEIIVDQPVYRGGRTVAQTRRAEAQVQAGRADLVGTEQDVLQDGVRAYMNVLRDQAVLDLNIRNEQRLRSQLQAARDRFQVGEVTRTDVSQAEARHSRSTADRIQAEGDLISSRAVYRRVIGEAPAKLTPPQPIESLPRTEQEAEDSARTQNPEVLSARFDEESARHNVDLIRGELLPEISLRGSFSKDEEISSSTRQRETAEIIAELTVPLYQSGSVYSRLRQAKETGSQRRLELAEAERNSVEAATRAWENLQTAKARVQSFEAEVRADKIALEGVQIEAQVGSRTVLDVLDAEQELLDAQVSLVRSQRDVIVAGFDLLAAIGRLTARDLKLPVTLYDFEINYKAVRDKWFGSGKSAE
ncbi:MAG: TolC family outer membrane protein [Alphaproteobacteria bacterium]